MIHISSLLLSLILVSSLDGHVHQKRKTELALIVVQLCNEMLVEPGTDDNEEKPVGCDDLLSYMKTAHTSRQTASCELDSYLSTCSASESALPFWKANADRFPRLYKLHLQHHCIPATSAGMERAFSAAGYIVSDRRSRLDDDLIKLMLIAKCNPDLNR